MASEADDAREVAELWQVLPPNQREAVRALVRELARLRAAKAGGA